MAYPEIAVIDASFNSGKSLLKNLFNAWRELEEFTAYHDLDDERLCRVVGISDQIEDEVAGAEVKTIKEWYFKMSLQPSTLFLQDVIRRNNFNLG